MLQLLQCTHMVFALNHWHLITSNFHFSIYLLFLSSQLSHRPVYIICAPPPHIRIGYIYTFVFPNAVRKDYTSSLDEKVNLIISKTLRINLSSCHTNRQTCVCVVDSSLEYCCKFLIILNHWRGKNITDI